MTRQDLEQIRYLDKELKMWEVELKRRREKSLVGSPLPQPGKRTGTSDKVADRGNTNVDLEREIERIKAEIQQLRDEAVSFVMGIPDRLTRLIIYYRCVSCMSWRRVAYEIGGDNTEDSVRMAYSRFMEKI